MKKIFLSAIVAAAAALPTFAAVDTLNYSAVVRDSDGNPVANQEVGLLFQFIENNNVVFEEPVTLTTSAAGVVNYAIGTTKSLDGVDWASNNIKLAVSVDVNGGAAYTEVSNSNVASVPTALYALKSADTENLYNDIDQLYGLNERTQVQLNNIAADFANLGENLDNSFAQVAAIDEKVEGLIENLDNSFARVEVMEEQVEANTTAIAEVKRDAYDAFEDVYQQLGAVEELTSAVEELIGWHNDNDETILSLPATLNAMNENIEANTLKLEEMEQANAELVATLQTLDNLGNENAEAIEDLYGKLERNQTVQNDIFAKISAAEEDIDNLYGQNERTQSQLNNIAADFANLGENLDNSFAQVTALEEKVDGLVENLDNSFARVEVMEEQVETLVNTLTDYIEQDQIVSGKVESMEGTVNYLREEVAANTDGVEDLYEKYQGALTVHNNIFAKIGEAQEDIEALQGADQRFQTMYNNMVADLGLVKDDVEALYGKDEHFEVQISKVEGQIAQLQNQVKENLESYQEDFQNISTAFSEMTTTLDTDMDDIRGSIERLSGYIEVLQNKVAALENQTKE